MDQQRGQERVFQEGTSYEQNWEDKSGSYLQN